MGKEKGYYGRRKRALGKRRKELGERIGEMMLGEEEGEEKGH